MDFTLLFKFCHDFQAFFPKISIFSISFLFVQFSFEFFTFVIQMHRDPEGLSLEFQDVFVLFVCRTVNGNEFRVNKQNHFWYFQLKISKQTTLFDFVFDYFQPATTITTTTIKITIIITNKIIENLINRN